MLNGDWSGGSASGLERDRMLKQLAYILKGVQGGSSIGEALSY